MALRSRLRLAPLRAQDMRPFLRATRGSVRLHRPWIYAPQTPREFRHFMGDSDAARRRFLLWDRSAAAPTPLVGYFSLGGIVRGNLSCAYVGYWATAEHSGRGLMTQGMELLLRHAFRQLRLHRLEANIQPGNAPSIALARRAGFRLEGFSPRYLKIAGRWRDHERWAMTVEDWRDRR